MATFLRFMRSMPGRYDYSEVEKDLYGHRLRSAPGDGTTTPII